MNKLIVFLVISTFISTALAAGLGGYVYAHERMQSNLVTVLED